MACFMGHLELVDFIYRLYAEQDDADPAGYLLGADARDGAPLPIHWACRGGHASVVADLISRGSPIHCLDPAGRTPLEICARKCWSSQAPSPLTQVEDRIRRFSKRRHGATSTL
jgi:ankyrin repeat protein